MSHKWKFSPGLAASCCLAASLVGCAPSDDPALTDPGSGDVSIATLTVFPGEITLQPGEVAKFAAVGRSRAASVTPTTVKWSASGGTISAEGTFSSSTPGTFVVVGQVPGLRRPADSAFVTVLKPIPSVTRIQLAPTTLTIQPGGTQQFVVSAFRGDNIMVPVGVTYSATGGVISKAGLYTAGPVAGTYEVIATEMNRRRADTSTVTVTPASPSGSITAIQLAPALLSLAPGTTQQFSSSALMSDGSVIPGSVRYSADGGAITPTGLYTAGPVAGTFRVIATQLGGTKADTTPVAIAVAAPQVARLSLTPESILLRPGLTQQFSVLGVMRDGTTAPVPADYTATGGSITPAGLYAAGPTPGTYRVVARDSRGLSDTTAVTIAPGQASQPVVQAAQWTVRDDGRFVDVDGPVLHVKFGYGGAGSGGWFRGGGGRDGGVVELYYKPTSPTRNLIFRNGVWGGGRDQLDFFQAETLSVDQADYTTPDFLSGVDATLNGHRTWQSGGRLFAEFDFQFEAWRIVRTYILYPWGDLTVHAKVTLTRPGRWNYLGHTFQFAVSPYSVTNGQSFNWGGNYESDGESFYAWSDTYGPTGGMAGSAAYEYAQVVSGGADRNSSIADFGRTDQYSGFMLDDRNGNDPDILVMNGDSTTSDSPFDKVARAVGGRAYVETGVFSPAYTTPRHSFAGTNWFYATVPRCCPPKYDAPMYWPASLGTWDEVFHVLLRRGLQASDYLPLWKARARQLGREAPQAGPGAQRPQISPFDRLYHISADAGAKTVQFEWAPAEVTNYTAFVVEHFDPSGLAVTGGHGGAAQAYYSATDHTTLLVLTSLPGPASGPYTITLTRP